MVRRYNRLLVAFYVVLASWLASLAIADARNRKCNPDELRECDTLGNVLLAATLLVPALLILLLGLLCIATVGLLKNTNPEVWVRQPLVIAVIGTLGLLAMVLGIAVSGNLGALL